MFPETFAALDGGDLLYRGDFARCRAEHRAFFLARAAFILGRLVGAGYRALALGEDDLSLGLDELRRLAAASKAPLLASNLVDAEGVAIFETRRRFRLGTLQVGVFSLVEPDLLRRPLEDGAKLLDPLETAAREVAALGGCDLLVLLSHCRPTTTRAILGRNEGIHVVLSAHEGARRCERVGGSWLLCPDGEGSHVGELECMGGPRSDRVSGLCPSFLPMDRQVPIDGSVETAYRDIRRLLPPPPPPPRRPETGPSTPGAEHRAYWGKDFCTTCHATQVRRWKKGPHSRAWQSLQRQGREEDPACLPCHVTGWDAMANFDLGRSRSGLRNVQCEACHIVGNNHLSNPTNVAPVSDGTCLRCHAPDRSPDFDPAKSRKALACTMAGN